MREIQNVRLSRLYWTWREWKLAVKRFDRTQRLIVLFLTLLSAFMLLPIVFVFNQAFKPLHELFLFPPTFIVHSPTTQNFTELLSVTQDTFVPVTRYLLNSIIVTALSTAGMVATGSICAYALSKHTFPGSKFVFATILGSLLFAPETIAIPRYVIVQKLGLMNTYWGHVLPMIAMPVGVFLIKQFIDQVPDEVLEAAKIDGVSELGIFSRIVVPMIMPAIATIVILAFQNAWSNTETSTLFMQDDAMKTLPFYMSTLTNNLSNSVARQGAAAAGALIMFLPLLVIFLLSQRKVIATMAHSGIK